MSNTFIYARDLERGINSEDKMTAQDISNFLSQPILGGLGLLLTVIFGISSLILYIRQRQQKDLRYYVKETYFMRFPFDSEWRQQFKKFISDQKINESEVEVGDTFLVTIWNQGKATIEASSISTTDPLAISVGTGSFVAHAFVLRQRKRANVCSVQLLPDRTAAIVKFEFLDWHDGVEIGVIVAKIKNKEHRQKRWLEKIRSASEKPEAQIKLIGTVIGVNKIRNLVPIPHKDGIAVTFVVGMIVIAILIGLFFSAAYLFTLDNVVALLGKYAAPLLAVVIGLAFLWAIFLLWHYRHLPRGRDHWHQVSKDKFFSADMPMIHDARLTL